MYTPKQPEAHSSQSQWLTWQSAWQPLCTLETPLRLHSRPVLPCSLSSPPYPLPSWRPPLLATQTSISHAKADLALQDQNLPIYANLSPYDANGFGNNSAPWNWHFTAHYRKYCPLTHNFLTKNGSWGESSLFERSPQGWSKKKWDMRNVGMFHILHSCTQTITEFLTMIRPVPNKNNYNKGKNTN